MKMNQIGEVLKGFILFLGRVFNYLSITSLLAMMLLTVLDVTFRYFFKSPLLGCTELTQGFMVCMVLGLGYSASKEKAIKMEMLVQRLAPKKQYLLDILTIGLGMIIVLFIAINFFFEFPVIKSLMMKTAMLGIPEYLFYIVMGIGFGHLVLVMGLLIGKNINKVVSRES